MENKKEIMNPNSQMKFEVQAVTVTNSKTVVQYRLVPKEFQTHIIYDFIC